MPGLGRIKTSDHRDHLFLAASATAIVAPAKAPSVSHRRWFAPAVLDQGNTPECVAFASTAYLMAGPVTNPQELEGRKWERTGIDTLYALCQKVDGIAEPHEGTTVRAAMKVLQSETFVTEYLWAYTIADVVNWILTTGPMVFGTDWLNSMFEPRDFHGTPFINYDPASGLAGGHAYLVFGADNAKVCPDGSIGALEMQNSWGTSWGRGGRAYLSYRTAAALLAEWGEAACAREVKMKPAPSAATEQPATPEVR
jgi:C1A family cysteine protease